MMDNNTMSIQVSRDIRFLQMKSTYHNWQKEIKDFRSEKDIVQIPKFITLYIISY